jgi:ABC-type protease/lipase transport system fused ATPase/permease subunit
MVVQNTKLIVAIVEIVEYTALFLYVLYKASAYYKIAPKFSLIYMYFTLSLILCVMRVVIYVLSIYDNVLASNCIATIIYALVVSIMSVYAALW